MTDAAKVIGAIASAVVRRVCELDYTPPEDFPDNMVMCTTDELFVIVGSEIEERMRDLSNPSEAKQPEKK